MWRPLLHLELATAALGDARLEMVLPHAGHQPPSDEEGLAEVGGGEAIRAAMPEQPFGWHGPAAQEMEHERDVWRDVCARPRAMTGGVIPDVEIQRLEVEMQLARLMQLAESPASMAIGEVPRTSG